MMMSIILLRLKFVAYNQISPNSEAHTHYLPTQSTESTPPEEEHSNCPLLRLPIYVILLYLHQLINCLHLILYFLTRKQPSPRLVPLPGFIILTILAASWEIYHPVCIISLLLLSTQ